MSQWWQQEGHPAIAPTQADYSRTVCKYVSPTLVPRAVPWDWARAIP